MTLVANAPSVFVLSKSSAPAAVSPPPSLLPRRTKVNAGEIIINPTHSDLIN